MTVHKIRQLCSIDHKNFTILDENMDQMELRSGKAMVKKTGKRNQIMTQKRI